MWLILLVIWFTIMVEVDIAKRLVYPGTSYCLLGSPVVWKNGLLLFCVTKRYVYMVEGEFLLWWEKKIASYSDGLKPFGTPRHYIVGGSSIKFRIFLFVTIICRLLFIIKNYDAKCIVILLLSIMVWGGTTTWGNKFVYLTKNGNFLYKNGKTWILLFQLWIMFLYAKLK